MLYMLTFTLNINHMVNPMLNRLNAEDLLLTVLQPAHRPDRRWQRSRIPATDRTVDDSRSRMEKTWRISCKSAVNQRNIWETRRIRESMEKISLNMDESAINRQWMVVDVIYKPSMIIGHRGGPQEEVKHHKDMIPQDHHEISPPNRSTRLDQSWVSIAPQKAQQFLFFWWLKSMDCFRGTFCRKTPFF